MSIWQAFPIQILIRHKFWTFWILRRSRRLTKYCCSSLGRDIAGDMGCDRGKGVADSSASDGKRKWGEHRKRGVVGSGPGSTSDGKQQRNKAGYLGVRNRGVTVEIKKWYKGVDKGVDKDVSFCKEVKMSEGEAAIVHDLARLYSDPEYPEHRLNIQKFERCIQKEDLDLASFKPLYIGKGYLDYFVEKHPLAQVREKWVNLSDEEITALKEEIAALAPVFIKDFKEGITRTHARRAGCLREEDDEIPARVQENDPVQELNKENQHLKDIISEKDDEIADLKKTKEEDDAKIQMLMETLCASTDLESEFPQDKEIQRLSAVVSAKECEFASLKQADDAALKAKDAKIASLEEELRTAQGFLRLPSPTSGLLPN